MASGGFRWPCGVGWAAQQGSRESGGRNLRPGACFCFSRALGGLHPWKRVALPRLESPPKLSMKPVPEPGNCPNLSSAISCRPLPSAGNSEDLVQHLGRQEADLVPCTGLAGRQETWQGGAE